MIHKQVHLLSFFNYIDDDGYKAKCRINYCWTKLRLFLDVHNDVEVDPRVPGIRDEIPFPQAKQCSPELDSPSCQFKFPFSQKIQRLQEKPIVTEHYKQELYLCILLA